MASQGDGVVFTWPKFAKRYMSAHHLTYQQALSQARPAWDAYKQHVGPEATSRANSEAIRARVPRREGRGRGRGRGRGSLGKGLEDLTRRSMQVDQREGEGGLSRKKATSDPQKNRSPGYQSKKIHPEYCEVFIPRDIESDVQEFVKLRNKINKRKREEEEYEKDYEITKTEPLPTKKRPTKRIKRVVSEPVFNEEEEDGNEMDVVEDDYVAHRERKRLSEEIVKIIVNNPPRPKEDEKKKARKPIEKVEEVQYETDEREFE